MEKLFDKKVGIGLLSAVLLLAIVAPSLGSALAQQGGGPPEGVGNQKNIVDCDSANPIENGERIDGDVRVKDGKECVISNMGGTVHITGDVLVGQGSKIEIWAFGVPYYDKDIQIDGDVKSNGGLRIMIVGSDYGNLNIGGDLQITNTLEGINVEKVSVGGSAQFNSNQLFYSIVDSTVGGSVQVKDNTSSGLPANYEFSGNEIEKNLQCSGNDPAPTLADGGPNTVNGKAQGQCEGLALP